MPDATRQLLNCRKCRRLTTQFRRLRQTHPDYWNQPVPADGEPDSRILVVGLAPGLHGANKTGKPFVGDASGDLLNLTLSELGLQGRVRVTNAVKCLPVKNHPNGSEVKNCSGYLRAELDAHANNPSAVAFLLGGISHRAVISALRLRQADFSFAHGAVHHLENLTLVDSYHCSRYNTQTGRLTPRMFLEAMQTAQDLAFND